MIPTTTSLETPFEYNAGDSIDDYTKKAELSPWTPVPDSVARKIFDRALPVQDDFDFSESSSDDDRSKADEVSDRVSLVGDFHWLVRNVSFSCGFEIWWCMHAPNFLCLE